MKGSVVVTVIRAKDGSVWQTQMPNLRVNDGLNWQSEHMGSSNKNPIRNIALTENSTAPASTDTNLIGEIAANGLSRKTATYSHTANASSYTQSASWQYTGASVVTIAKAAQAHDATDTNTSADTHFVITLVSPVAVLNSNDTISVDWGVFY